MLIYKTGSVFEAPEGSTLAHACNSLGSWGSGVAAEFKRQFPGAFQTYKNYCYGTPTKLVVGSTLIIDAMKTDQKNFKIACLITSIGYGKNKQSVDKILYNTEKAIKDLSAHEEIRNVHSPLINAGLFEVPWEDTVKVIQKSLNDKINWTVWKLEK